jgi:hypothetical protein
VIHERLLVVLAPEREPRQPGVAGLLRRDERTVPRVRVAAGWRLDVPLAQRSSATRRARMTGPAWRGFDGNWQVGVGADFAVAGTKCGRPARK